MKDEKSEPRLEETRRIWDSEAPAFDDEPDHGLRDPIIRKAWKNRLIQWLPPSPGAGLSVLDVGCGTGSLSVLLASLGHHVTGIDLSPAMLALAQTKAASANLQIAFRVMDAANPQLTPQQFDMVICRHLLWALPRPAYVLEQWTNLLKNGGRLVLIEGFWYTGAGLHASAILDALPPNLTAVSVENLSEQADLWGHAVTDERYVIRAGLPLVAVRQISGAV